MRSGLLETNMHGVRTQRRENQFKLKFTQGSHWVGGREEGTHCLTFSVCCYVSLPAPCLPLVTHVWRTRLLCVSV